MHAVQDSWCLLGVKKQMEHGWMLQWVVQVGPAVRYRDAHWDGPAPLRAAPRGNGQGVLYKSDVPKPDKLDVVCRR